MLTQQRPHIAFWSPLPPDRSGVADYSIGLLTELAKRCEIDVFTAQPLAAGDNGYPVYPLERYTAQAIRHPFDLNLYQLSNSFQFGAPYYKQLIRRPGLSIFHDLSLFDMFDGLYIQTGQQDLFWNELEYSEGPTARAALEPELNNYIAGTPSLGWRPYPMLRRAIEHSIGAIVHSDWAKEQIHQYRPTMPVFRTELGTTWPIVADKYYEAIDQILSTRRRVQTVLPVPMETNGSLTIASEQSAVPGLHFIGDLASADGLSESRLSMLEAMLKQQIPVQVQTLKTLSASLFPQADDRLTFMRKQYPISEGANYPIALLYANINELDDKHDLWAQIKGKYSIAVWFWELSQLSHDAYRYVGRVDEIWVPSRFVAEPFSKVTGVPIQVIPPAVSLTVSPAVTRSQVGLPDNRYVFFFHFSAASGDARKNPWAVIEAFKKAFGNPDKDGPLLVIKAHHLKAFPKMRTDLHSAMDEVGGLLIEDNYTRQQTNDLINCVDAYVSLHRSEGFGLGLAEAMYLGKPVLGTDYSSSTDFLSTENGYPVRYVLRLVEPHDHRYRPEAMDIYKPGQLWAEADTDHAAELMAMLYSAPEIGHTIGKIAAESIRRYCSPTVVGTLIQQRLQVIGRSLSDDRHSTGQ